MKLKLWEDITSFVTRTSTKHGEILFRSFQFPHLFGGLPQIRTMTQICQCDFWPWLRTRTCLDQGKAAHFGPKLVEAACTCLDLQHKFWDQQQNKFAVDCNIFLDGKRIFFDLKYISSSCGDSASNKKNICTCRKSLGRVFNLSTCGCCMPLRLLNRVESLYSRDYA